MPDAIEVEAVTVAEAVAKEKAEDVAVDDGRADALPAVEAVAVGGVVDNGGHAEAPSKASPGHT